LSHEVIAGENPARVSICLDGWSSGLAALLENTRACVFFGAFATTPLTPFRNSSQRFFSSDFSGHVVLISECSPVPSLLSI
jgi:hypothetical protein